MKRLDSLVRSSLWVVCGLVGAVAIGCGSTANPGTSNGTTESTGPGEGMTVTSEPGVTGSGGVTSGTTSTSSSASSGVLPTTAEPTCPVFLCMDFLLPECDIFTQECPEGEKCAPVITDGGGAWNSTRCVPVLGTDVAGDPCTAESVADGLDSCVEDAICWGVDMGGDGTCVAQCAGSPDAPICPNDIICTTYAEGYLNLCIPDCDPLLQDCWEGSACYPIDDGFTCAPDASGNAGKANDPCEFINVCDAGLLCAGPEFVGAGCPPGSTGCCTPFCKFPGGVCPNPDQQCLQWFDPAMLPPGDPKLGIGFCGVPQ